MQRLCYFHAGCPDGFGAAWAVWRAWGENARYVPRGHEDRLDARRHVGARVVFVDIAPSNDTLRQLADTALQVVVLDHHVTSRDRYERGPELRRQIDASDHLVRFDLDHSGAVLAWQHFHPDREPPDLLRYVEDQDLWNWKLPHSEEVNAAIGSLPREFEVWDELDAGGIEPLIREGGPIVRAQRIEVERSLQGAHPVRLGADTAEAVNAGHHRSSIGHELAKRRAHGRPWGVVYRLTGSRVDVSIYSIGDLDVSRVAASHGGGGHRNAAGFSVPLKVWLDRFL